MSITYILHYVKHLHTSSILTGASDREFSGMIHFIVVFMITPAISHSHALPSAPVGLFLAPAWTDLLPSRWLCRWPWMRS